MHVSYTDRCVYSQGVNRTYQRALERGFGGVGGRFNLYLEYDLEVELNNPEFFLKKNAYQGLDLACQTTRPGAGLAPV